jgi:hypothetical protein
VAGLVQDDFYSRGLVREVLIEAFATKIAKPFDFDDLQDLISCEVTPELGNLAFNYMDKYHNPEVGINWDSLKFMVEKAADDLGLNY